MRKSHRKKVADKKFKRLKLFVNLSSKKFIEEYNKAYDYPLSVFINSSYATDKVLSFDIIKDIENELIVHKFEYINPYLHPKPLQFEYIDPYPYVMKKNNYFFDLALNLSLINPTVDKCEV